MTNASSLKVLIHWHDPYLDMIFSDDSILMSLLERYDEENEIKDAVLFYCNRGSAAVISNVGKKTE